nr:IS3 family transposase [Listeria monocytogenes]
MEEYIEYYNFRRIKTKFKCSPVKYRENYYLQVV